MSPAAKWEYMKTIYERYRQARKKDKKLILDEFCKVYKCHRKHSILYTVPHITADELGRKVNCNGKTDISQWQAGFWEPTNTALPAVYHVEARGSSGPSPRRSAGEIWIMDESRFIQSKSIPPER